jgi:arylsulfatase A-like enzyme
MWLSYPDPHTPYQVSEPYASLYETENIPEPIVGSLKNKPERYCNAYKKDVKQYPAENIKKIRSLHYGMINQMDDSIGYVISVLKEYNMWENTIIIFTADHGDSLGDHGLMQKHQFFYDSFTHIPFMIKIPGITSRFTNSLTSLLDILPTILSALNLPELPQAQGTNLLPFLKGEKEDTQPYIVMECGNSGNEEKIIMDRGTKLVKKGGLGVGISIRTTGYKLNVYENDKCELYDLKTDSNELNNLYYNEASKAIVSELSNELLKHTLRIRDNIPVNRGLIDPAANDKRVVRWSPLQRKK